MKLIGVVLALAAAFGGWLVAFGLWGVGYCGSLTPDRPAPGTLRSDLCRGTSGDITSGVVVASWLLATAAPALGLYWARRKGKAWPLGVATVVGGLPLGGIAILSQVLPQS
jgi:hypothetical protein